MTITDLIFSMAGCVGPEEEANFRRCYESGDARGFLRQYRKVFLSGSYFNEGLMKMYGEDPDWMRFAPGYRRVSDSVGLIHKCIVIDSEIILYPMGNPNCKVDLIVHHAFDWKGFYWVSTTADGWRTNALRRDIAAAEAGWGTGSREPGTDGA